MASYRELLTQVRAEIEEITAAEARALHASEAAPLFLDVRERDEWEEGHIPSAVFVPRGMLEARIEALVPDRGRELVVYCAGGARSAFATKSLEELGYTSVRNLIGGFTDWKRSGFDIATPRTLSPEQRARYSRHVLIPEVGEAGQHKLLDARVLLIGAGGLGSPASLYLAAAASARSASWTTTSWTTRTCSARSSTRPTGSASRRCSPRSRRSRGSTRTSR